MNEFKEITIRVVGIDGESFKKSFDCYNEVKLAEDCPELKALVDKASSMFKGTIDEIWISAKYRWN